jgi:hypothetical protein
LKFGPTAQPDNASAMASVGSLRVEQLAAAPACTEQASSSMAKHNRILFTALPC